LNLNNFAKHLWVSKLSKKFKLLTISVVIILFCIAFYYFYNPYNEKSKTVIVAFSEIPNVLDLDPIKIVTLSEATILRSLYLSVFEYDLNGNIINGLAESFEIKNNLLAIKIRQDSIVSDGGTVSAEDVAFNLKRLMLKENYNYTDLKNLLCPNHTVEKIEDLCPGLKYNDNELLLTISDSKYMSHLIELLASVYYKVVPKRAFDLTGKNPVIKNFKLVTGGFYIDTEQSNNEIIILKPNIHSHLYSNKIPQEIKIIFSDNQSVAEDFLNGKIDIIPTINPVSQKNLDLITNSGKTFQILKTLDLKIKAYFFSKNAINNFTSEQRFEISKKLLERAKKYLFPYEQEVSQFFQKNDIGGLNEEQSQEIHLLRTKQYKNTFKKKMRILASPHAKSTWEEFFKENTAYVEPYWTSEIPFKISQNKRPEIYGAFADVSFNSSIATLSYALSQGFFGLYDRDADAWLMKYFSLNNKEEKIKFVNELHYNALKNCFFIPIAKSPYFAISNKKWNIQLNPYFAAMPLWLIRQK